MNMGSKMTDDNGLEVAIVGGGIAGLTLALGLLSRDIKVRIYERAQSFREIGAGIGFSPNAEWAMKILDPRIHAAFKKVAAQNATDWYQWVDGYDEHGAEPNDVDEKLIYKMYLGERGFEGCHRADFLDELVKVLPDGAVQFNRNLASIVDKGDDQKLQLIFSNGSFETADAVIGCDGIRSRVRQLILGEDNPASYPGYSHKYAFRGLVPMAKAKAALGDSKTQTRHMYLGPDAHVLTFPVAGGALLNVVAFVTDAEDWHYEDKLTAPAKKSEALDLFAGLNATVRTIMDLLPDTLDKWAIFDTYDHRVLTYVSGRVCIIGDAAHAAAPYHGAGAGFCIEDASVVAALIDDATRMECDKGMAERLRVAFDTYNTIRYERTQWLVESSRFVGEMYQWQDLKIGRDAEMCGHEIEWRSHKIWDYDIDKMMAEATKLLRAKVEAK